MLTSENSLQNTQHKVLTFTIDDRFSIGQMFDYRKYHLSLLLLSVTLAYNWRQISCNNHKMKNLGQVFRTEGDEFSFVLDSHALQVTFSWQIW